MDAELLNRIEGVAQEIKAEDWPLYRWIDPVKPRELVEEFVSRATARTWQDLYITMKHGNKREQELATVLFMNIAARYPGEIPDPHEAYDAAQEIARRGCHGARLRLVERQWHLNRTFLPRRRLDLIRVLLKDERPDIVKAALDRLGEFGESLMHGDEHFSEPLRLDDRKTDCAASMSACVEILAGMLKVDHPQLANALKAATELNTRARTLKPRLIELLNSAQARHAAQALKHCLPAEEFGELIEQWLTSPDSAEVQQALTILALLPFHHPKRIRRALKHVHLTAGQEDIQGLAAMAVLMGGRDHFLIVRHAVDQCERIVEGKSCLKYGNELMMNWARRLHGTPFEFIVPHYHDPLDEAARHVAMEIASRFFGEHEAHVGLLEVLPKLQSQAAQTLPLLHQLLERSSGERQAKIRQCMNRLELFKELLKRRSYSLAP